MFNLRRGIEFYRHSKRGYLLRVMTFDDMFFWGADRLFNVIFSLYVVEVLDGSIMHVGFIFMLLYVINATLSIPVGKFLDKHKGFDELVALSFSGFLVGFSYLLLAFATDLWHVYIIALLIGVAQTFNLNSWRSIFYSSIPNKERSETIGAYQTAMSLSKALIVALSGLCAEYFGFNFILITAGFMALIAGAFPLFLKNSLDQEDE